MLNLKESLEFLNPNNSSGLEDDIFSSLALPKVKTLIKLERAFDLALAVAIKGSGQVSPNPLVGCVCLTERGRFLSAGGHLEFGEAHAEVNAIDAIREPVRGAHVIVTLEPCSHTGKTPPCAELLIKCGVARVYVGLLDPNPKVSGMGIESLRAAGIEVMPWPREYGERLAYLSEFFLKDQMSSKLFVGLKTATDSLGVIANKGDKRAFITHDRSRKYGHYLRQRYDAIAIGADTLILDNPKLTPYMLANARKPDVVVFDASARALNHFAKMTPNITKDLSHKVHWVTSQEAIETHGLQKTVDNFQRQGVEWIVVKNLSDSSGWFEVVESTLYSTGCRSLLLEGGAGVWRSFLSLGLVDRVHWFKSTNKVEQCDPILFEEVFHLEQLGFTKQSEEVLEQDSKADIYSEWLSNKTRNYLNTCVFDGSISNRQFY